MKSFVLSRKLIVFAIVLLGMSVSLFAQQRVKKLPAKLDLMIAVQPDGDTLNIYLRGDEKNHFRMTEDGFLIIKNKKGFYCYAKECRGELKASPLKARNSNKRSKCDWRYLRKMKKKTTLYKKEWI